MSEADQITALQLKVAQMENRIQQIVNDGNLALQKLADVQAAMAKQTNECFAKVVEHLPKAAGEQVLKVEVQPSETIVERVDDEITRTVTRPIDLAAALAASNTPRKKIGF